MSRQLIAVIRATVNSTFGISAMRWRYRRRERLWEMLLMLFGIGTAVAFFGFGIYRFMLAVSANGLLFGQPELSLGLASMAGQVLVLFMGFFMVVSAFYFADDLETLVPLPVTPGTIVTAKFVSVLIGEYLTISIIYWPSVAAYAQYATFGIGKAIVAVLVFLALPVIPLAIGAAASLLLMRSISRRQRDVMFYAGSILFLVLMVAWQMSLSQMPEQGDLQKYLEELIRTRLGLVQALAGRFPPAVWATGAIHEFGTLSGLKYLGYTLAGAAAAVYALGALGSRLFMRGLLGSREAGGSGRKATGARSRQALVAGQPLLQPAASPLRALAVREWRLLSRTPIWMFNNVLPGLIMPVIMFVPLMAQDSMRQLIDQVTSSADGPLMAGAALAGLITFVGSVSGVATTSISREGARLWISRLLPQPAQVQLQAKLLVSLIVIAVTSVPTLTGYALLFRPSLANLLLPALVGLAGASAVMTFGLLMDSARPMLHWTDPAEPVKRNLNAIIPLLLAFGLIAAGGAITAWGRSSQWAPAVVYVLLFAVAAGAAAAAYRALISGAETRFGNLEL
jgi:ABC-2 type transport system permease protein